MWDLPGPGIKPVSPALASRFLTTAPPGKSHSMFLNECNFYHNFLGIIVIAVFYLLLVDDFLYFSSLHSFLLSLIDYYFFSFFFLGPCFSCWKFCCLLYSIINWQKASKLYFALVCTNSKRAFLCSGQSPRYQL